MAILGRNPLPLRHYRYSFERTALFLVQIRYFNQSIGLRERRFPSRSPAPPRAVRLPICSVASAGHSQKICFDGFSTRPWIDWTGYGLNHSVLFEDFQEFLHCRRVERLAGAIEQVIHHVLLIPCLAVRPFVGQRIPDVHHRE